MAGSAARRARRLAAESDEEDVADVEEEEERPSRARRSGGGALGRRVTGLFGPQADDGSPVPSSLLMQSKEISLAYSVVVVLVIIPIIFLATPVAKGAAAPSPVLPAIGAVLAVAMALSVRLSNRVTTSILAVLSSLAATSAAGHVATSVRFLSTVDLFAALGFALWISLRQSKARNQRTAALRAEKRAATRQATGRRGAPAPARPRKGQKVEEPVGPQANRRYTPPKKRS